ncbi:UNVERIFIED_CONTAM: hypothetical protein Slati_2767600 [Sesamum latifolium]|uniref:Uncharacterized protein n=1 Tax=Sesamum latifolium TaxID=2727402 RepID=A0AAW2VZ42_9LAMI
MDLSLFGPRSKSEDCKAVIEQQWKPIRRGLGEQESFIENLRDYRMSLIRWDKHVFGNVRQKIGELDKQICRLKQGLLSDTTRRQLRELRNEMVKLSNTEELTWKQRAKAMWLTEGDKNTAYFHARANERRIRNEVKALRDTSGTLSTDPNIIRSIV